MSLKRPDVPPEILRAFTAGLGDFIPSGGPLWSLLLSKFFPLEQQNASLPILALTPVDRLIVPAELARALPQTGWRFLTAEGDLYGACHVGSIRYGAAPILTGFSDDPLVLTAVERFNRVEDTLAEHAIHWDFTPSVLRITWLRFEAFWLHADPGGLDRVIPYAGFVGDEPVDPDTGLEMMTIYDLESFLVKIQRRAQQLYQQMLKRAARAQKEQAHQARQQAAAQQHALETFAYKLETEAKTASDLAASLPDHGKKPPDEPKGPHPGKGGRKRGPKSPLR